MSSERIISEEERYVMDQQDGIIDIGYTIHDLLSYMKSWGDKRYIEGEDEGYRTGYDDGQQEGYDQACDEHCE